MPVSFFIGRQVEKFMKTQSGAFLDAFGLQLEIHSFLPILDTEKTPIDGMFYYLDVPICYVVCAYAPKDGDIYRKMLYSFVQHMQSQLADIRCSHIVALEITIHDVGTTSFVDNVDNLIDGVHHIRWQCSCADGNVHTSKNEPSRLLHIEDYLAIAAGKKEASSPPIVQPKNKAPIACITIGVLCTLLLVYSALFLPASQAYIRFGLGRREILQGEYYRFISSMFFHADIRHLLSNGIFLYYFGTRLERIIGLPRFLILYFFCGIGAGVTSLVCHEALAIGASGALYGVFAAMLVLTKRWGAKYVGISFSSLLVMAVYSIGFGFFMPGTDNYAHIGGFLCGIAAILILTIKKFERNRG